MTVTPPAALTSSGAARERCFHGHRQHRGRNASVQVGRRCYVACTSPFNTGAMAAGVHTVYVQVTDTAGNITTRTATITVDQTAPSLTCQRCAVADRERHELAEHHLQRDRHERDQRLPLQVQRRGVRGMHVAVCNRHARERREHRSLSRSTDNAGNVTTGTTSITVDTSVPDVTVNAARRR